MSNTTLSFTSSKTLTYAEAKTSAAVGNIDTSYQGMEIAMTWGSDGADNYLEQPSDEANPVLEFGFDVPNQQLFNCNLKATEYAGLTINVDGTTYDISACVGTMASAGTPIVYGTVTDNSGTEVLLVIFFVNKSSSAEANQNDQVGLINPNNDLGISETIPVWTVIVDGDPQNRHGSPRHLHPGRRRHQQLISTIPFLNYRHSLVTLGSAGQQAALGCLLFYCIHTLIPCPS